MTKLLPLLALLLPLSAGCSAQVETAPEADIATQGASCHVQGSGLCGDAVPLTCDADAVMANLVAAMGTADADCWNPGAERQTWCCIARSK